LGIDVEALEKSLVVDGLFIDKKHDEVIPNFLLRKFDNKKFYWDLFIVLLVIFSSISIPFAVAFDPLWSHTDWYKAVDLTCYAFYFVDMILGFRTTYFSVEGEVMESWPIAKNYLTGTFLFDFVTGIPISYLVDVTWAKTITTLRVVRLLKLRDIINNLYVVTATRAVLKLSLLIFGLMLLVHILACLAYVFIM
jgi:hypothetical protein